MQDQSIEEWLESLASKQPTPGGGAAAALMAATSAALLGMVSIFTTGPKWAEREAQMQKFSGELEKIRAQALSLADADAEAFGDVSAAYKMPQGEDRATAIQKALVLAAEPPVKTALLTSSLVGIAQDLAKNGNPNVISDVAVAAACARAALESAIVNMEINQRSIKDSQTKKMLGEEVQKAETSIKKFDEIFRDVQSAINGPGRHPRLDRGSS